MSNVIAGKAFQGKYVGLNSSWVNLNVEIPHLDEIEDDTFSRLDQNKFKKTRRASVVFVDGIRLLNEKGIKTFGLNKTQVWVDFNDDYVQMINNQVAIETRIQNADTKHEVRIDWKELPGDEEFLVDGHYFTTSASRGKTPQGQGAVDFLTVSALFGEGLRNLLFDKEKNRISLIVLRRFIDFRRFYLNNKRRLIQKSLTDSETKTFREMIVGLSDVLYMSGAYFRSESSFEKRHIDTRELNAFGTTLNYEEVLGGKEALNPDFLENLVKAYT